MKGMFSRTARRIERLEDVVASLDVEVLARDAACSEPNGDRTIRYREYLETYLNEAVVGLRLIEPFLGGASRILEVGAGIGVLTRFLAAEGFDIIGIEPGATSGFAFMPAMSAAIANQFSSDKPARIFSIGVEDLDPSTYGHFDLIFSVNVLEHVMRLKSGLAAMSRVLSPAGTMVHLCPNYGFPYEPHLAIPLIPGAPRLTRHVFPSLIRRRRRIWDNINFVTASRLVRLARRNGLCAELQPGVMSEFFERLRGDALFRSRHPGLLARLAASRQLAPIVKTALHAIPAGLATPMIVTLRHMNPAHPVSRETRLPKG